MTNKVGKVSTKPGTAAPITTATGIVSAMASGAQFPKYMHRPAPIDPRKINDGKKNIPLAIIQQ